MLGKHKDCAQRLAALRSAYADKLRDMEAQHVLQMKRSSSAAADKLMLREENLRLQLSELRAKLLAEQVRL